MRLSEISLYDLTAENPSFKVEDVRFAVMTQDQHMSLDVPAYKDTVKVYKVDNTFNKEQGQLLTAGSDYNFEDCEDYDSMSNAKILALSYPYKKTSDTQVLPSKTYYKYDPDSDAMIAISNPVVGEEITEEMGYYDEVTDPDYYSYATIVNKIRFSMNPNQSYYVIVEYQGFKKDSASVTGDGEGPVYTPGLMRTVIDNLNELKQDRIANVAATNNGAIRCLEMDLTGRKSENFIKNEVHNVDTTKNQFVIRPICGSFYNYTDDDLKLVYSNGNISKVLVKETGDGNGDYEVLGVNFSKTAMCEPPEGVYEFIALRKAFVGTVSVDYHAFGGEISVVDINSIMDKLIALQAQFGNSNLLTAGTLGKSVIITNMLDRIEFLEHQLQHYRTQTFMYTSKPADFWVNVAYISGNAWMNDAPIHDHDFGKFQFTIQQFGKEGSNTKTNERSSVDLEYKLSYEATRDSNGNKNGVLIRTKEMHMTHSNFLEDGMLYFDKRFTPKFRVISNAVIGGNASFDNGLMLQMSITSIDTRTCFVSVSDKTDAKSPWLLVDSLGNSRSDAGSETSFNGALWKASAGGWISNVIPIYGNGYTVFAGSIATKDLNVQYANNNGSYLYGDEVVLPNPSLRDIELSALDVDIVLDAISKIRITVFDRYTEGFISVDASSIAKKYDSNNELDSISSSIVYFLDDMCGITVIIKKVTGSKYGMNILGYCGTNSVVNDRFYLTQVDLL